MRYEIVTLKSYRTALKRMSRHKHFDSVLLEKVVRLLAGGETLPSVYKDHRLTGSLRQYRECHIKNDLLLVYQKQDEVLILYLIDIGTHASLFG